MLVTEPTRISRDSPPHIKPKEKRAMKIIFADYNHYHGLGGVRDGTRGNRRHDWYTS